MTSARLRIPLHLLVLAFASLRPGAALGQDTRPPLPTAVSGFDGWRGVKLLRGRDCPECCKLVFPAAFGHRKAEELELLQAIVAKGRFRNDLDCVMLIDQDALRQMVKLAVRSQDDAAALAIVRANGGGGMSLGGGELAEVFASDYLVPVLLGFRRIGLVLTRDLERHVAAQVCYAAYDPSTSADVDEKAVAARLRNRGAKSLARAIDEKCEEVKNQFGGR